MTAQNSNHNLKLNKRKFIFIINKLFRYIKHNSLKDDLFKKFF